MRRRGGTLIPVALLAAMASACALSRGHTQEWVGRSASELVASQGMPEREMTAPSGAKVYVYPQKNLEGAALCHREYYIRGSQVVGYAAHGFALNCSGSAGETR